MRRLLLVCAAAAGCYDAPLDLERMDNQVKIEPFERSEHLPGRALLTPPAGTVPRGTIVDAPALTEGVVGGVYVDTIPVPVTRELVLRGRERYDIYCAPCHGLLGDGVSEIARQMPLRKPPSLVDLVFAHTEKAAAAGHEHAETTTTTTTDAGTGAGTEVVDQGPTGNRHGPGGFYVTIKNGFGLMPSYQNELSIHDRWAVVAYIQALTLSQRARIDSLPPDVKGELQRIAPGGDQ
jgi:mono/diheme cytochrome c family protein